MKTIIAILIALNTAAIGSAALKTSLVEYKHGKTVCEGYLAYDDEVKDKRPGVIVVHEWKGLNEYAKKRADQLAGLGYIAFAIDMYGKGVRAQDHKEAGKLSGIYRNDRQLMRARAKAGLEVLKNHALTDPKRIAAIGYCFGGTTVLEMARNGEELAGVASFHGSLNTPNPKDAENIKGKVVVFHGGNDGFIPAEEVTAFQNEMKEAGANWQMNIYGGAVHSFTVPSAGNDPSTGMAYDEQADKRSWQTLIEFFKEIFSKEPLPKGSGNQTVP